MRKTPAPSHAVEGVKLPRPFHVRRLGHFGINVASVDESLDFYGRLLGFEVSDQIDFGPRIPEAIRPQVGPTVGLFTRHGTDHHSFVLFPKAAMHASNPHYGKFPKLNINQITWQVSSLREVVNCFDWFEAKGLPVLRSGRDTPGSNWHLYPVDPAGHVNELYYGIEQIGWTGYSKPLSMHGIRYTQPPQIPHRSEFAEVNQGIAQGLSLESGYRRHDQPDEVFDVGGVLLARPFKICKVGPVRLFVDDIEAVAQFYQEVLGLAVTEQVDVLGHRCWFFRANTEHHALALYPEALRDALQLKTPHSLMGFGVQLGSYQQLRDAVAFLAQAGVHPVDVPQALSPGMGHHVWVQDPDGNLLQLYWEMEQIGWNGQPRPAEWRRQWHNDPATWPEAIDPLSDSFLGEVFLGPLN